MSQRQMTRTNQTNGWSFFVRILQKEEYMSSTKEARSARGRAARDKGKRGEREVAERFRAAGYVNARRAVQYNGRPGTAADVTGVPTLHIEVKRVERDAVRKWIAPAIRDAKAGGKGDIPVVCHRKSGEEWLVSLRLDDFLTILGGSLNGNI